MRNRNARKTRGGRAKAGSQLQIQIYVNRFADELSQQVLDAQPVLKAMKPRLRWVSPLERENFVEYYDQGFLRAIECPELTGALGDFWPPSGPRWDALAVAEFDGQPDRKGVVLVEAKSGRIEIFGNGCGAVGENRKQIEAALAQTREWLGMRWGYTKSNGLGYLWAGPLYQYANRLAHLCFFREVAKIDAWLVNVYFVDDPDSPTGVRLWDEFLPEVKDHLGLTGIDLLSFGAADLYLEAKNPREQSKWGNE